MSSNCCCKKIECCCCCYTTYDVVYRIGNGQNQTLRISGGPSIWTAYSFAVRAGITNCNAWIAISDGPHTAYITDNAKCPSGLAGKSAVAPTSGNTHYIISVTPLTDCSEYDNKYVLQFSMDGTAPSYSFGGNYRGEVTRDAIDPCKWTGTAWTQAAGAIPQMDVILYRNECHWNIEIRNGVQSIWMGTGRCSSTDGSLCNNPLGSYSNVSGHWNSYWGNGTVSASGISVASVLSPAMATMAMSSPLPVEAQNTEPISIEPEPKPVGKKPCRCSRKKRLKENDIE